MDPRIDYYALLGVLASAEDIVIQGACQALAQRYHPDRYVGSKDEATSRMAELNEAYGILSVAVRRSEYDIARIAAGRVAEDCDHENLADPAVFREGYRPVDQGVPVEVELYRSFAEKLHEWGYSAAKVRTELVKRGVPESTVDQVIRLATGPKRRNPRA
jgi:curved DNA-binding protein CbpA